MPVISRWLVPGKVIYTDLVGDLTLEDLKAGSDGVISLYDESEFDQIHVIANQAKLGNIPVSLKLFNEATPFVRDKRLGWFIMYPEGTQFAKFMASMVTSLAKIDYRPTDSLENALSLIKRMDDSLPDVDEMMTVISES